MSLLADFLLKHGVACADVTPEDYRGDHKAPGPDYGAPLYDVSNMYPKDIYTGHGFEYAGSPEEREGLNAVFRAHNKPWLPITIYRAVPKDVAKAKINVGDWVTTSRAYAKEHGEAHLGGKGTYKILKLIAHARDLYTAGDSLAEWGYYPREATEDEKQQVNDAHARAAQDRYRRAANGEKIVALNKYPGDLYFDKPAEFFQQLLDDKLATSSVEIPDTIIVNGATKPTHNSLGDLIHASTQGIENFWNWFGDSKTVDAEGRPIVYYHGVGAAGKFKEFRKDLIGASSGNEGHYGKGFYFTEDPKEARIFSEQVRGTGEIISCYLRITKPFKPSTESLWEIGKKNPHLHVPDKIPVALDGDDIERQLMDSNPKAGRIFHILRTHPNDAWAIITKDTNGRMPSEPSAQVLDTLNDAVTYTEPDSYRGVDDYILKDLAGIGIKPKLIYGHKHELYMPYITDVGERGAAWTKALQADGYDGVIAVEIVAFDADQIKSTSNIGTFNPGTTDITASVDTHELTAMAAPLEQQKSFILYHGTDEEHAKKIIQSGCLQGRIIQGKAQLAPVAGYVYTSKDIMFAIGYAGAYTKWGMGCRSARIDGSEKFTAYIFVTNTSKVTDILVDEDTLGELGTQDRPDKSITISKELQWYLKSIARDVATDKQLTDATSGLMGAQSAIGKKMQKVIPAHKMQELIECCPHLALKHPEQCLPIVGYYTIHKSVSTPEEFFKLATYHKYTQHATASVDYQDDTEHQDDHDFLTKLGLIFGQPKYFADGVRIEYKGHELEIKPDAYRTKASEGRPSSRGRKAVKPTYKESPGILITNRQTGVSHRPRREDAERWLRGIKNYWDRQTDATKK